VIILIERYILSQYVCSPFGIMLGYGAGFLTSKDYRLPGYHPWTWRIPLLVQGVVLCILAPLLATIPMRYITGETSQKSLSSPENGSDAGSEISAISSGWSQFMRLMKYPVFIWTSATLSVLFFVVTGIQFWISCYLIEVLYADETETCIAFILVSATAPTAGVVFGGWLVDHIGLLMV
jgi:MFS transporter, Spinster family, sphingosine-1-phosphate transporter